MKSTRLRHLFFLLTSTAALHAQSLIEQDCTIQIQSTGVKLLNWTGHVGRTYFIQSSPDLANWSWAPNIEAGENRPMSYEVDGPAKAGFFRLQYTDLTAPNLEAADFDGDGLDNLDEITQRPRPTGASLNQSLQTSSAMPVPMSARQISSISTRAILSEYIQTNPLKADTDDDGLTDKWEEDHQLDPTDNGGNNPNSGPNGDPDQDGLDNLSELQNGTNPMNEDTNGDGVSDSDDYHSAPLVWPVIWTHNFIEAWAAKSTPLFREFVPTISSANPTPIVRWYMQKDISGFNGQSTSFPTNLHDSYRVRERVDPDSGEVTYSITEEPIEQEQGPWVDFENGNWYIESESHHEVTKTRDFYESIDHVTLRTLGITGVETHRYETNLSNEFTTAMLMQDLGERFNELQREKEQEPWNFGGSGISGITSFISRSEEKSQKMKCDYAMEPPSSPVSSNVRIAWLEVSAPNQYRGDIAIVDDPRPPVVKLYQEFFTAARLAHFNRPFDSSQPASPKTAVHTLSPDQNQEMKVMPLACELTLYHRLGTLVANQQTGGTIAPTPDWSAPTNGSLGWSISGTLGSRPQANDSPQNTDVLWDEFNVPIRLEVIEGAENIRLAARSDAGNGIENFTPVTLPIADLREYPSGFVLQSTGPGRVVIRASLVTKHGLRIVSTTESLMGLLDLDVDSDNSGEIDGSLAEDEIEADPAQPGKLFVYTPSSGDAPGSPESWFEMSLKTSSLRASDKVQFNYDDDQMTISNSRPDQNPVADKRVVSGQAYMLTELSIVPGTPKSFYVRPGQECSGRQLISVHIIAANPSNGTSSDLVAVNLLPVDFKKMWETSNKANQIVVKARRDDPATSSQQPDAQDNLYGAPRNVLYITANPADGKYHVSINIAAGMRDQFVGAAYKAGSKVSGTDKAFSATEDQPVDMLIPATGSSQSGEDFVIKVAYDSNKNGLIDTTETAIELEALKSDEGASLVPMVRGFSAAAVTAADSTIQGQAFGTGWTGWKPNWVGGFFVPNAIALEKLFYTGNAGQLDASYAPTVTLPDATLNALGSVGDFNEWLTHHTGVQFDSEGIASIKHYQWAADSRISNLIAASTPLSTLKGNGNVVTQMQSETTSTVNAYKQAGVAAGQSQVFPNANGHDLQAILASLGKPHWSPSWVPKQTLLIGDEDGYAGAVPDDAFGTVGRSRFLSGKYWFVVKKENRIDYEYIPDAPAQEHPYTAVVVYLRISGTSQDLYDFNHNAGGLSVPAAITQLSYGNGSYGRSHGFIYRTSVNILNDYEMQEIRLP